MEVIVSGLIFRIYVCHYDNREMTLYSLVPGIAVHVFCQDAGAGMDALGRRLTGVNWFDRANELSPVNQGLMGYLGTANLVRKSEQVKQSVRHT